MRKPGGNRGFAVEILEEQVQTNFSEPTTLTTAKVFAGGKNLTSGEGSLNGIWLVSIGNPHLNGVQIFFN